jgi:hypothetical protein
LFKRSGKQIRRSLKTDDPAAARRRLGELRNKVARINSTKGAARITFANQASRRLGNLCSYRAAFSLWLLDVVNDSRRAVPTG